LRQIAAEPEKPADDGGQEEDAAHQIILRSLFHQDGSELGHRHPEGGEEDDHQDDFHGSSLFLAQLSFCVKLNSVFINHLWQMKSPNAFHQNPLLPNVDQH